ncbi:MAG: class I SAM-dependent methyltransferase [Gammaproteobacteria bacterium]|nr:MAG: class I SAM-dependent methyltransferase [Gammaproteobacteria bacterium]
MSGPLSHEQACAFYDRFGSRQDSQAFYEDAVLDRLIEKGALARSTSVFEFGCGTGRLAARLLAGVLPEECRYVGVDISQTMVTLARERLQRFGARARVLQSHGETRFDFPEGSFDRFLSTFVLDLLPEEEIDAVINEASRLVRPGGLLLLTSLTEGTTLPSRLLIALWKRIWRLRPSLVGGCRPIRLTRFVRDPEWRLRHREVLTPWAVPCELLVAERGSGGAG